MRLLKKTSHIEDKVQSDLQKVQQGNFKSLDAGVIQELKKRKLITEV